MAKAPASPQHGPDGAGTPRQNVAGALEPDTLAPDAAPRAVSPDSWRHGRAADVDRDAARTTLRRVPAAELESRIAAAAELLEAARPHLEWLSAAHAAGPHVACVADRDGVVLWSTGAHSPGGDAVRPGTDLSEAAAGTNGVGTALAAGQPVAVEGEEHHARPLRGHACAGAPIRGPGGEIVGVIALGAAVGPETAGRLVVVAHAAHAIERELGYRDALRPALERAEAHERLAAALRDSEARFRGAFEHAAIGMTITGTDGRWIRVNGALCDMLGHSNEELVGRSFQEVTRPDDREPNGNLFRRALAGEIDRYQLEKRYVHKRGHDVWVVLSAAVVRDEAGEPLYLVAQMQDISGRERATAQLRESEARYERSAANIPGMVYQFVYWPDGRKGFTYASDGARRLFGIAPETMLRDHEAFFDLVHPEDRPGMHSSGAAAVAALSPWRWKGRVVLPTGEELWVQVAARNELQPDGSIRCDGLVMDVTELRRAEEALSRRERELVALAENSPDVIARLDRDCRHLYVNSAAARVTGIPAVRWSGRTHAALGFPPSFAARWREAVGQVFETGKVGELEFELPTPEGPRWFECRLAPELAGGTVESVLAIGRDVTEHRRAEEALRQREAHFRSLSVSSPVGIFHSDTDGNVTYANPRSQQIWGMTDAEFIGRGWVARVHPEDAPDLLARWAAALEAGREFEHEYRLLMPDGAVRRVRARAAPLRSAAGDLAGTVGTVEDITEQRLLEAQLRQAQKMEAVGQLAGGVAHDFNNLLTVIGVHADILAEEVGPASPGRADLEAIRLATGRATTLTRQLLAFSRKQLLQPRMLDLNEVVAGLEPMLRRLIGEDIQVVTCLDPSLGHVLADPGQLEQVLVNLAVNARDAMPDGGSLTIRTANVEVAGSPTTGQASVDPGSYVTLSVTDSGCGMSREVRERIFEPFFTTKSVGRGTGLGLPTVYGIVRQSGGHLEVESAPGRGSTFALHLPRIPAAELPPARPARVCAERPRGAETILLVEDEAAVRRLARRILERQGYTVLESHGGPHALEFAAAHRGPIDLVLTDMVMPDLSGRALAEQLAAARAGLRVLFMSGYTDDEIVRRGLLDAGDVGTGFITGFIEKPFTADTLSCAVRSALDGCPAGDA